MKPQSIGGKVRAIQQRQEAIQRYMDNPNICKFCNKIILVRSSQRVSDVKKKKFCNKKCAASFNNRGRIRGSGVAVCIKCKVLISLRKNKSGVYVKRKYCVDCLKDLRANNASSRFHGNSSCDFVAKLTKKQVRERRGNYQSARSSIRNHACQVYRNSFGVTRICSYCDYDKQADVSHIRAVGDFSDDTLVVIINDINNLVALCKRCHWEYDNGFIFEEELVEIVLNRGVE